MKLNTIFITDSGKRIPIMYKPFESSPLRVDVHVQLVNLLANETQKFTVKVFDPVTKRPILDSNKSFNMKNEANKPKNYDDVNVGMAELGMPLSLTQDDIKDSNKIAVQVTIDGETQTIELFLAGEIDG